MATVKVNMWPENYFFEFLELHFPQVLTGLLTLPWRHNPLKKKKKVCDMLYQTKWSCQY